MPNDSQDLLAQLLQRNQEQNQLIDSSSQVPAPKPAERLEMSPLEKALFMKETGVKFKVNPQDIYLGPQPLSQEELLRRADALINMYSPEPVK